MIIIKKKSKQKKMLKKTLSFQHTEKIEGSTMSFGKDFDQNGRKLKRFFTNFDLFSLVEFRHFVFLRLFLFKDFIPNAEIIEPRVFITHTMCRTDVVGTNDGRLEVIFNKIKHNLRILLLASSVLKYFSFYFECGI